MGVDHDFIGGKGLKVVYELINGLKDVQSFQ